MLCCFRENMQLRESMRAGKPIYFGSSAEANLIECVHKELKVMHWSMVLFGRYENKTLPETIMRDLDWFFLGTAKTVRQAC